MKMNEVVAIGLEFLKTYLMMSIADVSRLSIAYVLSSKQST